MSLPPPLLQVSGLTCRRGTATQGFSMEIPQLILRRGDMLAITGPSGSGKSTVLDVLGLVLRPTVLAEFHLDGVDVGQAWRADDQTRLASTRAVSIGYILQTGGLLPFLSVRRNLTLSPGLLGRPADGRHMRMLMGNLGLGPLLEKMPADLSIGERQRVAIARALAHRPALILADEPTASLDPVNADAVLQILVTMVSDLGLAMILVSHDWQRVAAMGMPRMVAQVDSRGDQAQLLPVEAGP